MMSCQMKKRFFFGTVREEEEVLSANIDTDSDSSNGESDDSTPSLLHILSACWAEIALFGNAPIQLAEGVLELITCLQ